MKHRQAVIILLVCVLAFTAIFTTLLHMRYRTFASHDWRDEGVDNQIIYNSAHGRLGHSTIKGPMFLHRHFRPIFFVCAIPWLVVDKIQVWFVTVGLILGLGAFGVYGFARRRLRSVGLALAFAVGYLCWQPLHEVALGNYDPETLVATFWLFAALAYESEKRWTFWIWVLMALICKETMAVVLFGFGVLALVQRRKISWWLPPLVIAPAWFFAAIYLIIPIYHPTFDTIYGRFIGCNVGGFPACFLAALFSEPMETLRQIFSREHLILLSGLLRGMGFLSFVGFEWLLPAIPVTLEIILLKDPHPVRQAHILSSMLPFIYLAGIIGLARIAGFLEGFAPKIKATRAMAVALAFYFAGSVILIFAGGVFGKWQNYGLDPINSQKASNVFDPAFYRFTDEHARAWETISLIPETATAMTNNRFLLALSSRPILREFGTQSTLDDFNESEYILVSLIEPICPTCTYNPLTPANLDMLRQLVETERYRVVRAFGDHVLLVRKNVDGPKETADTRQGFIDAVEKARAKVVKDGTVFENLGALE